MNRSRAARNILLGTSCLFTAALLAPAHAGGLPTGGTVVSGTASITNPTSNSTVINQATDKAIFTWQDFSIASGSSVTFNQPGSTSIALNRVLGPNSSQINGDLFANGHVWLINGNGVMFGKGSRINVGSLIATTADMADNDFLNGTYKFGSASGNPNAAIVNNGTIHASQGGSVILGGPVVANNGIIQADLGNITLGGVSTFTVDFQGDNLLRFQVGDPVQQTPNDENGKPVKALVSNTGTLSAKGGKILLTTRAAQSVVNNVINNTGMIEATSVSMKDGEIVLDAGDGTVELGGTVDASGKDAGETGGAVTVEAKTVVVADNARIDVSGDAGGGSVHIGGGAHGEGPIAHAETVRVGRATITADAVTSGDGGEVVLWSDGQTQFGGTISARGGLFDGDGGFVETSGAHLAISTTAMVDTLAPRGKTGLWLLDPANIVVQEGGETELGADGVLGLDDDPDNTDIIDPGTIVSALGSTNVTLEASNDIIVVDDLIYSSTHALNMLAQHSIEVLAVVQNTLASAGGAINLIAGWDGETAIGDVPTTPGAYGNNGGTVLVGGEGANPLSAIGAASGALNVYADEIIVDATSGYAQLGYHGAGGGDILARADSLVLQGGGGSLGIAQIGNGSLGDDVSGAVTGNIDVRIFDQTFFEAGFEGGGVWVGNGNGSGDGFSGDVLFTTGNFNDDVGGLQLAAMIAGDLDGGDVTIGVTGDSLTVPGNFLIDTPHDLTLMSTSNVVIAGLVQNQGSGSLTAVGGWDGTTIDHAHLTDAGVFGNNGGSFVLVGGEGSPDSAFGSKSGTTTVAAHNVYLLNELGFAQIGYHGAGTGDIDVFATGDLLINGGDTSKKYALIGNGLFEGLARLSQGENDVGGDITVEVAGLTTLAYGGSDSDGGLAWLGNVAFGDGSASGNVSLTTGQVIAYGTNTDGVTPNTLGIIVAADLGTTAETGGDFTLAITAPNTDYVDAMLGGGLDYTSPHDFTLVSTGNLTIANTIQNHGSGDLTMLAGWNPAVAPSAAWSTPGGFGQNGMFVWVVAANASLQDYNPNSEGTHFVDSGEGTAVGTRGGNTNIGGSQIFIEGLSGYAQVGYHGDGGSGAINVTANGTPGDGGLTGVDACFDGMANICVIGGRDGWGEGQPAYAQIGNLGLGVEGSSSADINVRATGNIAVTGGGIYNEGEDPGIENAYGMIGSGDASATTTQNVSGNIDVRAGGQVVIRSSSAPNSLGWIGNRTEAEGTHSGNVTLIGSSVDGDDMGQMIAYDLGTDADSGGNFLLGLTGLDGLEIDDPNSYSSAHTLSLLSAGDITVTGTLQNSGSGDINMIAGWDGTTLDTAHFTDAGVYGNNSGRILIGGEGAGETAGVGTRGGTLTAAANEVVVSAFSGDAQLGYHGAGAGNINVFALNDVFVATSGDDLIAQIGNGDTAAAHARGDIAVHAQNIQVLAVGTTSLALIGNRSTGPLAGNISLFADTIGIEADGNTTAALVGHASFGGGSTEGDIVVEGDNVSLGASGSAHAQIGHGGNATAISGAIDVDAANLTLFANGTGSDARIGATSLAENAGLNGQIDVNAANTFTLTATSGGRAFVGSSAAGLVSGDISVMGGEGAVFATGEGSEARIGHSGIGQVEGDVTVDFANVVHLFGDDSGTAAIGGSSVGTVEGNISVTGGSAVTLAASQGGRALIGHGATGAITGNIGVDSEGVISLAATDAGSVAMVGSGGDGSVTGDIAMTAGDLIVVTASGAGSTARVGSGATGDILTNIDLGANLIALNADEGGLAVIGSGGGSDIGGSIDLTSGLSITVSAGGDGSTAFVGNAGLGALTGDITLASQGTIGVTATDGGNAGVGAGGSSTIDGDIVLNAATQIAVASSGANSTARVGHGAASDITGDIALTSGGAVFVGTDGNDSGAFVGSHIDVGGALAGDISVTAENGGVVVAASGDNATALIGHGGVGSIAGDIRISATGSDGNDAVSLQDIGGGSGITVGANGDDAFAGIGHGPSFEGEPAPVSGAIDIETSGTLTIVSNMAGDYAQVGHYGGSGDITVHASDLTLVGDEGGIAHLGNGSLTAIIEGAVSGDIDLRIEDLTTLNANGGGHAWLGNANAEEGVHTGTFTLITGETDDESNETDEFADILVSNLQGGDVTLGITAPTEPIGPDHAINYDSEHTFNLLVAGDIEFGGSLQNAGSGDINIVAGWDGETLDPAHFGDAGVFGNDGAGVGIGSDGASGVAVGSREGTTTVLGAFLDVDASQGFAQLGYHGSGASGDILVNVLDDVTVGGDSGNGAFAQIGHGGRETQGSASGDITITAGGDLVLSGGAGDEFYAQVGHGGAEANPQSQGYAYNGDITVDAANVSLEAGTGDAAYVQIGHGGYKVGAGLTGESGIGGDITVTAAQTVSLTGGGNDAYAQIGHGGDQLNTNAGANAHGSISGDIVVGAPNSDEGAVTMTAGGGANAYVMIGNGGYSINGPTTAPPSNFTISGNISVTDLALTGGEGENAFAQIGNGDASHTGTADVSGDIFINAFGGNITLTNGAGNNANASIHNAIGHGTVTGNIEGFESEGDGDITSNPTTSGTIVVLTDNTPPPVPPKTDVLPDVILSGEGDLVNPGTDGGVSPIEEMSGGDGDEGAADKASEELGGSLDGGKKTAATIILTGFLKQEGAGGQSNKPHGIPTADEDFSSWGNEALWQ